MVAFDRRAFGLEVADRCPQDGFTIVDPRNATSSFELTVNGDEPHDKDDGCAHLAVLAGDLRPRMSG